MTAALATRDACSTSGVRPPAGAVPDRRRRRGDGARVDAAPAGRAVAGSRRRSPALRAAVRRARRRARCSACASRTRSGWPPGWTRTACALPAWPALGFGFVEVGTVTWHAAAGQPPAAAVPAAPPRGGRSTGWASTTPGAAALAARLGAVPGPLGVPLGISLGKSKVTPLEEAVGDYLASLRALHPYGDYFAVNVARRTRRACARCRTASTSLSCSARRCARAPPSRCWSRSRRT